MNPGERLALAVLAVAAVFLAGYALGQNDAEREALDR